MSELTFTTISIIGGTTSFVLLFYYFKYKRYLILKASFWFSLFFFIQIQLYATLFSGILFEKLTDHFTFLILVFLVPTISLFFTGITLNKRTNALWILIQNARTYSSYFFIKKTISIFILISILILVIYLSFVPFHKTGFYMVFFSSDPLAATIAREKSLKLLPFEWLKYTYQFFARFLALFIGSSIIILANYESTRLKLSKSKRIVNNLIYLVVFILMVIGCMLPGARVGGVLLILCMGITYFILNGEKINLIKYALVTLLMIIPAILTQYFKYGFSIDDSFSVVTTIFERIMAVPIEAGIKWLNYIDYYEIIGFRGFALFSFLDDRPSVHVPNMLMNHYYHFSTKSGFLTTSFIFAYYAYVGPIIFPILILLIQFLDFWIILYSKLRVELLLPTIVTLNMAAINLTGSEYFQAFITYGYLIGLIFIFFIDKCILIFFMKSVRNSK